jgi:tetratricopeptide (TPR) repeat protein
VVGTSYLRAGDPVDTLTPSRSGGYAATANREEVERLIRAVEDDVRVAPTADRYTQLGQLYLDRARTTGDLRNYAQAETAATRAVDLAPADPDARSLLASVRYSNHDFAGALALARAVVADDASQIGALATVGDAQLELGAYEEASAAFASLAAAKPDAPATVIRLARLAYVQGKPDDARRLAAQADELARATALGGASLTIYVAYHAQVELDTGHYREAARLFTAALEETPGSFVALSGLGRARAAEGRRGDAIGHLEQAVAVLPDPATLATLADLYQLDGKPDRATTASGTVELTGTLSQVNRQLYNRVLANFYADHDVHTDEALRLSEAELAARKDVFGYDTYAWALYKNGRLAEARAASDQAGWAHTRDARLLYHSGMIARAQGDVERARADLSEALALSPHFDPLQAPRARDALAGLTARS